MFNVLLLGLAFLLGFLDVDISVVVHIAQYIVFIFVLFSVLTLYCYSGIIMPDRGKYPL